MKLTRVFTPILLTLSLITLSSCDLANIFEEDNQNSPTVVDSTEALAQGKIFAQDLATEIDVLPTIQNEFQGFGEVLAEYITAFETHNDEILSHFLHLARVQVQYSYDFDQYQIIVNAKQLVYWDGLIANDNEDVEQVENEQVVQNEQLNGESKHERFHWWDGLNLTVAVKWEI